MNDFPKIKDSQLVLVRALSNTGQVLDEKFHLKLNDSQNIYTIFNSIEEVELYVKAMFNERIDIEFWLYDYNNEMLRCYVPEIR